ncbi:oxidoreductase [Kineosporia rhizophila]|uniref:oxidoreductase n=1 Tax=Kineosporia rhizophila TaxID=84633 RepID=UPI001E477601|nr:oxidoreductase [Kineosporia rhizophila]MCE0540348.1 oxidoreductase [Kineosporia rhizophila]
MSEPLAGNLRGRRSNAFSRSAAIFATILSKTWPGGTDMTESRVWLITGTSSGLGRAMAEAAAEAGDLVIATARRPETLDDLVAQFPDRVVAMRLDVTDRPAIEPLVTEVLARHGRIDVLVNNAGHGYLAAVEETGDSDMRRLFELHVFGPAALTRAVLPGMRARRKGAIVQMSSVAADFPLPAFGVYGASKAALEGMSETLAAEVGPLGITVMIAQPGGFRTKFCGETLPTHKSLPDYAGTVDVMQQMAKEADGNQAGDPAAAARAILSALSGDRPPLRLPLGSDAVGMLRGALSTRLAEIEEWEAVARSTDYADVDASLVAGKVLS